jgi:hypothetical protein
VRIHAWLQLDLAPLEAQLEALMVVPGSGVISPALTDLMELLGDPTLDPAAAAEAADRLVADAAGSLPSPPRLASMRAAVWNNRLLAQTAQPLEGPLNHEIGGCPSVSAP